MSNANYFDYYKANNVEFYFAILKEQIEDKAYQKLAFDFQRDFDKNIIKETIWLASDKANDNITSKMIEYYGEDLQIAFEKCKADAVLKPNGLLFTLVNDPYATVKDYLEYKRCAESAVDGNMEEIDNNQVFEKIEMECKSKELQNYFNKLLNEEIKNNNNIDWYKISTSRKLSPKFIEDYEKFLDIKAIHYYQKVPEDLLKKHILKYPDEILWGNILNEQNLSEEFIIDFADNFDKFDWMSVSIAQNISEKFIKNFADKLNIRKLLKNNNLDNDLKEKIKLHFDDWVVKAKSKNKIAKIKFICNIFYKKAFDNLIL